MKRTFFFSIRTLAQPATSGAITEVQTYNLNTQHTLTFTVITADDGIESGPLSWAVISSW